MAKQLGLRGPRPQEAGSPVGRRESSLTERMLDKPNHKIRCIALRRDDPMLRLSEKAEIPDCFRAEGKQGRVCIGAELSDCMPYCI